MTTSLITSRTIVEKNIVTFDTNCSYWDNYWELRF